MHMVHELILNVLKEFLCLQNVTIPWQNAIGVYPNVESLIGNDSTWLNTVMCYNIVLRNSTLLPTASDIATERRTQLAPASSRIYTSDYDAVIYLLFS